MTNELVCLPSQTHCQFKLDVDIKKYKQRPLCQAFGKTIYKAEWIAKPGPPIVLVKIHGAKATREAAFYVQLSCHPQIVRTFGLIESDADSVMLVQERALEGDLSERLRENEFRPSQAVLLDIFLQIIDAMICLADNRIVHGDLACRNVLIYELHDSEPSKNVVKLTDFGLTRTSTLFSLASSTVSTTLTVIPIRYAAPELIHDADKPIYSEKSDIYSMGVLMWEALSSGQLPYTYIEDDKEVCRQKLRGKILDKPDNCDQALWTIITRCWQQRPEDRPTFKMLRETILEHRFQSVFSYVYI
jgi:serine/threonine protein kinase